MAYLQSNIPHFKCWVRREYTHNHNQYHGEYLHALAIAVTCIPDRCLSFHLVFTGAETYDDDNEPDALAYGNMVSLCIKAIQEQQTTITALEARIAALEAN